MQEKGKKIISLSIILFMVLNYLLPLVNYAEFDLGSIKDAIVKRLDENQEEIGREYEIKETEEWDISLNGDRSVIAKWKLEDRSLTISGTGKMKDWEEDELPDWHNKYKNVIEKAIIENGVTNIGEFAFYECSRFTEIYLSDSVTSIGWNAFYKCIDFREINVSEHNMEYSSIDGVLFNKEKTELILYPFNRMEEKYSIPDGVLYIETEAFYECCNLVSIEMPESLTTIGDGAFNGCSKLTEINIPESVSFIGWGEFYGCKSLKAINVVENNTEYCSIDGVLFNKEKTELIAYPANKEEKKYSIPDGVTHIDEYTFEGCSNLIKIDIPYGVISIGDFAFSKCSNLIYLIIPESVTNIEIGAFYDVNKIICKTNSVAHKYAQQNNVSCLLDDDGPIVTIKYYFKEPANQIVTVTLTANEEIRDVIGWTLSQDKKQLSKEYSNNTTETITIKDLVGNETKQTITINNIDKTPEQVKKVGDVNENNKIDIGDILLLKRHIAYTNSTSVANKHSNWKLSDEKIKIGDINKNSKIDIGDILKLQRYISASNSKEVAEKHRNWLNL